MTRKKVKRLCGRDSYDSEQRGIPNACRLFVGRHRKGTAAASEVLGPWMDNESGTEAVFQEDGGLLFRSL